MNAFKTAAFAAALALVLCGCPGGGGGHSDGGGEPDGSTPLAQLALSDGPTYDFGTRATGYVGEHAFTLTNSGAGRATDLSVKALAAPFAFKGGSFPGTGGTCGLSLDANSACTVVVTYAPTVKGAAQAQLSVGYNNGQAVQSLTRDITGNAVGPASLLATELTGYDYGTVPIGYSGEHAFNVTNSGEFTALALQPLAGLVGPFDFKGGSYPGTGGTCGSSLAPGAMCTVVVTFTPLSAGRAPDAALTLGYNDGAAVQTLAVRLFGNSAAPADLSISDGVTYDYGVKALGSATDHAFTVTNLGGLPASSISGSGLSGAFAFKGGSYPGTGGTCGATLASLASCTVVVTFSPPSIGLQNGTLTLAFNDGAVGRQVPRAVRGTGIIPAIVTLSDAPSYDFGTRGVSSSTSHAFTLTNSGGVTATGLSSSFAAGPYSFKGGFPGTGGTCASTLAVNASCTVVVTFAPTSAGNFPETLNVFYDDGAIARIVSRALTAVATAKAFLSLSDGPTYDFGTRATDSTVEHTFTVSNTGAVAAQSLTPGTLGAPFAFKGGSYPGQGGTCGAQLSVGGTCTVVVTFSPTQDGDASSILALSYNDGGGVATASLTVKGTGTRTAALAFDSGASFDYGTLALNNAADHTFTVTNTGGSTATALAPSGLSGAFTFKGGAAPGTGGTCGTTLPPGASCTYVLSFAPTATGPASATLTLSYSDGLAPQTRTLALSGNGAAPASLLVSDGPTYDFGSRAVGSSTRHTFTVNNVGGVTASALGASLAGPFAFAGGSYPGQGGTCGATLNASESCTLVVAYQPTAAGSDSGTLSVTYNDGAAARTVLRPLSGSAAAPAVVDISDAPSYDFGTLPLGRTGERFFTLTNSGAVAATGFTPANLPAPFAFKGGTYPGQGGTCDVGLLPGTSCTVVVTFAPQAVGLAQATLALAYQDGVTTRTATRPLQGTGAKPALLAFSGFDYGVHVLGTATDHTFTVTNQGGVQATSVLVGDPGNDFTFKGGFPPGQGGTCGPTLDPGASCTFVLTYQPSASGPTSFIQKVTYGDGVTSQTVTQTVSGTGAQAAHLAFSDGAGFDFGQVLTGTVARHTVTVANDGGYPAQGLSASGLAPPFGFEGGAYPGTGGTCGATLANGTSCTVVLAFAPTASGAVSSGLALAYDDGATARSVSLSLSGRGALPALLIFAEAPTYDFGSLSTGSSATHVFTVTNTGEVNATGLSASGLSAPFAFRGASYPGLSGTCGSSLSPGASCTLDITFTPTNGGPASATLSLGYGTGVGSATASVDLRGAGVRPPKLVFTEGTSYNFGAVLAGSSREHTFTVTNTGDATATSLNPFALSGPFAFTGSGYPGQGGTCGTSLAPGASCNVVVAFSPTAAGNYTATLALSYAGGDPGASASLTLQGTSKKPAQLAFDGGSVYAFGAFASTGVGRTATHVFTVTNTGEGDATGINFQGLTAPFSLLDGAYPGTGGTCSPTLAAGASCTVVAAFSPTADGTSYGDLTLQYGTGAGPATVTQRLQGTGTKAPYLVITDWPESYYNTGRISQMPGVFDFGTVGLGATVEHTFTVTNEGGTRATGMTGVFASPPFGFKGGNYPGAGGTCGLSLGAGESCSIVLTFTPTSTGTVSSAVGVNYDGASFPAGRSLQGTGTVNAALVLEDGPGGNSSSAFDFGSVGVGTVAEHRFTLRNVGAKTAAVLGAAVPADPFGYQGGAFPGKDGTCGASLAPGASCTLALTFSPKAAVSSTATASVSYDDGGGSSVSVARDLKGTGVTGVFLTVVATNGIDDDPVYDFGTTGVSSTLVRTFTVTNVGSQATNNLTGTVSPGAFYFSGGGYPGFGGTCGTTLAPGASCTVVLGFSPFTAGLATGSLSVSDNGYVVARPLLGTGTDQAHLVVSDDGNNTPRSGPYDFGTSSVPVDHTFVVYNDGKQDATGLSGNLPAGFTFKDGAYPGTGGSCPTTLPAFVSCSVVVTFSPKNSGSFGGALELTYFDGATSTSAQRGIVGRKP